jgi:hypothetical protein
MTDLASFLLMLVAIAFGCFFLQMGKQALLSQERFLRFCNRWQKTGEFGIQAFDLGSFGGPTNLRLVGVGLSAIGLFIIVSVVAFLLIRLGYLT